MTEKIKILAVEDDEAHRVYMTHHLEAAGFEVILADDGDVVLKTLESVPDIAVILLDRKMGRMSGLAVLESIKQTLRLKDIPVILQTATRNVEQLSDEFMTGVVYDHLAKPYSGEELVKAVREAIKNSKYVKDDKEN